MRLRCSWGMTRFVVLIGPVAIKFARFRVMWIAKRLFHHMRNREVRTKVRYQLANPTLATNNIFAGFYANRLEYHLWCQFRHPLLVPTLFSLAGLINVQRRGEEISESDLNESNPFKSFLWGGELPPEGLDDLIKTANFCFYDGRVRLIDYGSQDVTDILVPLSVPDGVVIATM